MHRHSGFLVALSFLACIAGCGKPEKRIILPPDIPDPVSFHRQGTVGEYAVLSGARNVHVSGYGLVIGLGSRGDNGVPPEIERYLVGEISRSGIGFYRTGTELLSPLAIVRGRDTAVAIVSGVIPPFAPAGTRFDLKVDALPNTDTSTLDGGHLMEAKLYLTLDGMAMPAGGSLLVAHHDPMRGDLFLNPFLDPGKSEDVFKFREGWSLNGGVVTKSMDIRLELRQPDWNRAVQIARAINTRFDSSTPARAPYRGGPPTTDLRFTGSGQPARAVDNRVVEVRVPLHYRDEYPHFLELVMSLPLARGTGVWEARAEELIRYMESPGGDCPNTALVLEAMGRTILPVLKHAYASPSESTSYYCAVTGLRLGDSTALPVVIFHAMKSDSPFRMMAIEELSGYPLEPDARITLENLLDDDKDLVRITAYEGLMKIGRTLRVQRTGVADAVGRVRFFVDVVQTRGKFMVYATQSGQPRVALFGQGMAVKDDAFVSMPGDLLTINGQRQPVPDMPVLSVTDPESGRRAFPTSAPMRDPTTIPTQPSVMPTVTITKGPVLMMDRMMYRPDQDLRTRMYQIPATVKDLVHALGTPMERDEFYQVRGLGMTYGQVVSVLYRMCRQGDIPATFVLQDTGDMRNIWHSASTMERPDMPGQ